MRCNPPEKFIELCPPITEEEAAKILADLLPNGKMWVAKFINTAFFRRLIKAKSGELFLLLNKIVLVCNDFDPAHTEFLIERWERLLGIPDDCFTTLGDTLEERRKVIFLKMAILNTIRDEQDYIDLAKCLGFDITIKYPDRIGGGFPYTFPFILGGDDDPNLFTVCIEIELDVTFEGFPYTFPFRFGIPQEFELIICLFNKLKPAHIRFKYDIIDPTPPPPPVFVDVLLLLDDDDVLFTDNDEFVSTDEIIEI